ncbi:hypothetical protein V6Z93_003105 [Aspergillus fumigatus]
MAISILMGDFNLVRHYNATRRMVPTGAGMNCPLSPTFPARGLASTATDSLEPAGEFVCLLGAAERGAKESREPGSKQMEDHGKIGRNHCDKGLPVSPFAGQLCTIDGVLSAPGGGGCELAPGRSGKCDITTHHQDKHALQDRAHEDEQSSAKDDGRGNLFDEFEAGFPEHGDGD